jgi:hypothetical protein
MRNYNAIVVTLLGLLIGSPVLLIAVVVNTGTPMQLACRIGRPYNACVADLLVTCKIARGGANVTSVPLA